MLQLKRLRIWTVNHKKFYVFIQFSIIKLFNLKLSFLTDATKASGKLLLWIQWENGATKFVPAKDANKMWPEIVIRFYESHVQLEDE